MVDKRRAWLIGAIAVLILAVGIPVVVWALIQASRTGSGTFQPEGATDRAPAEILGIKDSVTTQVTPAPAEASASTSPKGGGTGVEVRLDDNVEYLIRDASGKVKEQKSAGGK
jgi:hypothetical protein